MKKTLLFILVFLISCSENKVLENEKSNELFLKANKLYNSSNYTGAIALYNQALEIDSENPMLYLKRGDSYRKIRKPKEAIKDYDKVLELRPANARALYHRGTLKIKLGQADEGCMDVQKSMNLGYLPAEQFYKTNCK